MANEAQPDVTSYYYVQGKRVSLAPEPRYAVVRFHRGRSAESLGLAARRLLQEESSNVAYVPQYDLKVFERQPDGEGEAAARRFAEAIGALEGEDGVELASVAVRRLPGSPEVSFVTRQFLVQFKPEVTRAAIDQLNQEHGVALLRPLEYAANGFLLEAPESAGERGPVALANRYFERGVAEFAHPDFVERRYFRELAPAQRRVVPFPGGALPARRDLGEAEPTAVERDGEYLAQQWHLRTAKVVEAWALTRGDPAVTIAVLDDGVDVTHPEFAGKVRVQRDFQTHTADASPKTADDKHGTSCAGVAVARGAKAFGSAPGCSLIAVRTPSILGVADEADMFRWTADQGADVITCSWGPQDNAGPFALVDNVRAAIRYCCTSGRGGNGIPVLFAAGNGNELVSDDGYAANPDVLAIAASTSRDTKAPYSDFGPEIFVCAPSSGDAAAGDPRIFTTDRTGAAGYNPGNVASGDAAGLYTNRFGGTSSATPLVAGVVGLMLSANRDLTLARVKEILRTTADRIGGDAQYDAAGHSASFGFGRVNAEAAVRRAREDIPRPTTGGAPSISAPAEATADAPPTFQVSLGDRALYAVELSSRRELLDPAAAGRTASDPYGSWVEGLRSAPTYQPPAAVWRALSAGGEVFFRAHFANDARWGGYVVSEPPERARSIRVRGAATPETPAGSGPSISGPASAGAGEPPAFDVRLGDRRLFAVELATSRRLLDAANAAERTAANHYGSWVEGLRAATPYTPPAAVWSALAAAGEVFYLGHFADDAAWSRYVVSGPAAAARSVVVGAGAQPGAGAGTAATEVRFPSGATFRAVTAPVGSVDYADPAANGAIPLIDTSGREQESLSRNFKLVEFMAPGARYARVSPRLVKVVQALRDKLAQPLRIDSAYRHPALNRQLGGAADSEHLAGRAVLLRGVSFIDPKLIGRAALEAVPDDLGLGLGPRTLHLDVGGRATTFTYTGASLTDEQFAAYVQGVRRDGGVSDRDDAPEELPERIRPAVSGPERLARDGGPLVLEVRTGMAPFFAIEVAASYALFGREAAGRRTAETFYASWGDGRVGLSRADASGSTVFVVPEAAWDRLKGNRTLYYRVLTTTSQDGQWKDLAASTPDDQAATAPRVVLADARLEPRLPDGTPRPGFLLPRALDERAWAS